MAVRFIPACSQLAAPLATPTIRARASGAREDKESEEKLDWYSDGAEGVYDIKDFIEFKTTWHPIGV